MKMKTTTSNVKIQRGIPRVRKGVRYILLLCLMLVWGIFFLLSAATALNQRSFPALLATIVLIYFGFILLNVYRALNPVRSPFLTNPTNQLKRLPEEVVFESRDGSMLSGWFFLSQVGPTLILTHGFGGNRSDLLIAASHLLDRGFGVLMYDLRAHGRSPGNISTWGWIEVNDLHGAVDFLQSREEVNPEQIGAMGYSLGGQITIRAAAENEGIRAIIAEDPSPASVDDHVFSSSASLRKLVAYPAIWLGYKLQEAVCGVPAPRGVRESISKISPRPILLIASGMGSATQLSSSYFQCAGEPKDLWQVPEANHGWIAVQRPDEYGEKLCRFFEKHLLAVDLIEYT
ncbi:MAG: alpha/beta fold hydrolase [Chloroflexota bacterium]|nr:MAG: alpha/beta fold hydrolase [Chloroflexota bacterium]